MFVIIIDSSISRDPVIMDSVERVDHLNGRISQKFSYVYGYTLVIRIKLYTKNPVEGE